METNWEDFLIDAGECQALCQANPQGAGWGGDLSCPPPVTCLPSSHSPRSSRLQPPCNAPSFFKEQEHSHLQAFAYTAATPAPGKQLSTWADAPFPATHPRLTHPHICRFSGLCFYLSSPVCGSFSRVRSGSDSSLSVPGLAWSGQCYRFIHGCFC